MFPRVSRDLSRGKPMNDRATRFPESSTKLIKRPFRRPAPFHFTLMVIRCLSNRWGWNCPVILPSPTDDAQLFIHVEEEGTNDIFRLFLRNFNRVSCLFIRISDALLHFYITFLQYSFFLSIIYKRFEYIFV